MRKRNRSRVFAAALACVLMILVFLIYLVPQIRVNLFVHIYHEMMEEGLSAGNGVPADHAVFLGYDAVNTWEGVHSMTEFIIMAYGSTYYGCYYSPADIPLAFQNVEVELIQTGDHDWEWNADGDNHGFTSRILDHWYFFGASL